MATSLTPPRRTILHRTWLLVALMIALLFAAASPALAHKEHKKKQQEAAHMVQQGHEAGKPAAMQGGPTAMHAEMGEMMEHDGADRADMTFLERLMDWLGRTHPVIVHFPIAFFPAALVTAIVGRRRPAFGTPVRFLVVTGGIIAPLAAILGWLDAMGAEPDQLLTVHRWLGTAIGIGALGLGLWAWRKPEQDRSTGMIVALTVITAAIIVQGWFGGAMVHGIDHMNW
ncbi:MAG: hypothetical protein LOX97_04705 [Sphingomonas sp.]|nr:hypothetical protein [Sphingomonas sp.]